MDTYLSWEELASEGEGGDEAANGAGGIVNVSGGPGGSAPGGDVRAGARAAAGGGPLDLAGDSMDPAVLNPELAALLGERKRLENQLNALTGQGEPQPEDARVAKCFPVFAHTVETRIEERRLARHDERSRMHRARALARVAIARREAAERVEKQRTAALRRVSQEQRERQWREQRDAAFREAAAEKVLELRSLRAAEARAWEQRLAELRERMIETGARRRGESDETDARIEEARRRSAEERRAEMDEERAAMRRWEERRDARGRRDRDD